MTSLKSLTVFVSAGSGSKDGGDFTVSEAGTEARLPAGSRPSVPALLLRAALHALHDRAAQQVKPGGERALSGQERVTGSGPGGSCDGG